MTAPDAAAAMIAREKLVEGCSTMKKLLEGLLDSKGRVAEEVHAIRKLGKSLRGGFSLFRLEKSGALEVQAIGRLLGSPRDAVSRHNTWVKLGWVGDPQLAAAISGLLDVHSHSAARRPPPETIAWAVERVEAALSQLRALPAEALASRASEGLARLERRVTKRCLKLDHRSPEDFHEARKALKAWLGCVSIFPTDGALNTPRLEELADLLGDENDLATLAKWLRDHGFTRRFAPGLWKTLGNHRKRVQRQAIRLAAGIRHEAHAKS